MKIYLFMTLIVSNQFIHLTRHSFNQSDWQKNLSFRYNQDLSQTYIDVNTGKILRFL